VPAAIIGFYQKILIRGIYPVAICKLFSPQDCALQFFEPGKFSNLIKPWHNLAFL
jgi:hypothetical protein